jgi:16S rRNA (adenine1518-N6/adenine1519-N6)-dimethyltransferase
MSLRRPPWQEFKAALEAVGFHPSKRLGQNFMLDVNTARAIVADARLEPESHVLEIGVGCGFLSCEIVAAGHRLVGVEIDRRLFDVASGFLLPLAEEAPGSVELLRADALAKKRAIEPAVLDLLPEDGAWHLVSNLPYSVASPLLVSLSRLANPPRSMTVLVQLEVAERVCAQPGGGSWGGLSAKLGLLYSARLARRVGPGLFWPPPKVDSAVARLELFEERPAAAEVEAADRVIEACFQARRKTLRSTLGRFLGDREAAEARLEAAGIDPKARPEVLAPRQFLQLAQG